MSGDEALAGAVRASIRHLGYRRTLMRATYRLLHAGLGLSLLRCIRLSLDQFPPRALQADGPFEFRFLEPEEIERFAADPANRLSPDVAATALRKGDECFAALDGDRLVCQGWYSHRPTRVEKALLVHFDPKHVLMYHGFTHPKYRGRRAHAASIGRALVEYTRRGAPGLVSLYNITNYATARSIGRMGWEECGTLVHVGFGRASWVGATRACAAVGFGIAR